MKKIKMKAYEIEDLRTTKEEFIKKSIQEFSDEIKLKNKAKYLRKKRAQAKTDSPMSNKKERILLKKVAKDLEIDSNLNNKKLRNRIKNKMRGKK